MPREYTWQMESKKERRKRKYEEIRDASKREKQEKAEAKGDETENVSEPVRVLRGLNVFEYAQERAAEMVHMSELMDKAESERCQRLFQLFPRHMRRRAASYDIRRIPKRFREKARMEDTYRQVQAGLSKKKKEPNRRKRRRPSNLREEYLSRQKDKLWLETHIWHAKRFHMVEKWGYKLPATSTQRGIKASYRMSSKGCTLQDISFLRCIEIAGKEEDILSGVQQLTSKETGLTFAAKGNISGAREGHCFVYCKNSYPYKPIGPVHYLWKSVCSNMFDGEVGAGGHIGMEDQDYVQTKQCMPFTFRHLLIWCHPLNFSPLKSELISVFSKFGNPDESGEFQSKSSGKADNKDSSGAAQHQEMIFSSKELTVRDVSFELRRLRLTGPLSHSILQTILNIHYGKTEDEKYWWSKKLQKSYGFWKSSVCFKSHSELPSHVVIGLTVLDPRLDFPPKKLNMFADGEDIQQDSQLRDMLLHWPDDISSSALWSSAIRKEVTSTKHSDAYLNKKRSELLTLEPNLCLGSEANRVPILLIQRPGSLNDTGHTRPHESVQPDYGGGWDIILPSGWVMPFWMSLIYGGARAVGLLDADSIETESLKADLLINSPDTESGGQELMFMAKELEDKMKRRPSNKRINYQRLGVNSPFLAPWSKIVTEWADAYTLLRPARKLMKESGENAVAVDTPRDRFYVLRNASLLRQLDASLGRSPCERRKLLSGLQAECEKHCFALTSVSVRLSKRGSPDFNGLICVPTSEDLHCLRKEGGSFHGPQEALHKGPKKDCRHVAEEYGIDRSRVPIVGSNDRWILGHVTNGKYCLSRGKGGGVGLVSLLGLLFLAFSQEDFSHIVVLVRNPSSLQYRFASLAISFPTLNIV